MLAIFSEGSQSVRQLLSNHGITRSRFSDELAKVKTSPVTSDNPEDSYDALKKYGTDLVERARTKELDPVIGRDAEIRNVIRILSRKTKNNPVLIGEPGVGKTAIAEGLAQRIVRGDVPEGLKDRTIFSLDMGALTRSRSPTARSSSSLMSCTPSSARAKPRAAWMPATS